MFRACSIVDSTTWSGTPKPAPGKPSPPTSSPSCATPTFQWIWSSGRAGGAISSEVNRPCRGNCSSQAHAGRGGIGLAVLRGVPPARRSVSPTKGHHSAALGPLGSLAPHPLGANACGGVVDLAPHEGASHMATDQAIIDAIRQAFAAETRPEHFTDDTHCCECAEHDALLASRDLDSLRVEDVNNAGWDPICFVTAASFRYYLPALVRLALDSATAEDWYCRTSSSTSSATARRITGSSVVRQGSDGRSWPCSGMWSRRALS
jgi:hypothetical protein